MFCIRKLTRGGIIPLFLLCGCFKTPSVVGIKHAVITGFSDSLVQASVSVDIKNDNIFSLSVRDFSYRFCILHESIGGGSIKEVMVLRRKAVTTVHFYPEVNFRKVAAIPDSLFMKDSIPVTFYLSGKFTFLRISKNRKFTVYVKWKGLIDSLIDRSVLSEILKIKSVALKSLSLEKSELNVTFDFNNFLPFKITLDSFAVNVLNDIKSREVVGSWKSVEMKDIHSGQTETVPAVISIQNINMLQSAFQKVFTGDFAYYFDGKAYITIEGRKCVLPVKQKADITGSR